MCTLQSFVGIKKAGIYLTALPRFLGFLRLSLTALPRFFFRQADLLSAVSSPFAVSSCGFAEFRLKYDIRDLGRPVGPRSVGRSV
jgi:hypothetical protein